jgi:heat shock protein HtpX
MWNQIVMTLLTMLMFSFVYAVVAAIAAFMGIEGFLFYGVLAFVIMFVQYMIGPKMVEWTMGVRYVSEKDAPKLHQMVAELAEKAGIKKPKVAISEMRMPNAFAFGRSRGDGRICVTRGILDAMNEDELRAVIGHEMSHIKNRDVLFITLLSVLPMIFWFIFRGSLYSSGKNKGGAVLIGVAAFFIYFITNLIVLFASRFREYHADKGSVNLGNKPNVMASALYKLVYGSAKTSRDDLQKVQGLKAFFMNDPSKAMRDFSELKVLDRDMSGTIDKDELANIRNSKVKLGKIDRFMEIYSTHPNMLKRIQRLSKLA